MGSIELPHKWVGLGSSNHSGISVVTSKCCTPISNCAHSCALHQFSSWSDVLLFKATRFLHPECRAAQDPSCWSCQPHFSDEEYILLRGAALKQQLAAAGHPLPAPQLAPLPPPFNPTVEHEQRSYLGPLPLQEVHQEQLLQQHQALLQAHAGHVRATKVQPEPQQELEAVQVRQGKSW